ncbi:hypothetical protein FCM35_KLT02829 [Carex littledalei]|uniref:Uncharacterized protein n=1 Tax=Carex littledalei TaxID=544730 RepID=A0A833VQS1_9POAL|nr:hypothetical protein FCM35_KLT02829 [Carex littledalei]
MEKDRSIRGSQQQFSIYSNKGGIIVKEEVSSEKAFTKAVKDICVDESTQPLIERNMSLNFDHSVVGGVLAMELAREPALKNLTGPIASENDVSGPIKIKKLGVDSDSVGIPHKPMNEDAAVQIPTETTLTNETATANQTDLTTVDNAIDKPSNNLNTFPKDIKSADNDSNSESKNPGEVGAGTDIVFGTDTSTGGKPVSPSKEKAPNEVASPKNSSVGNNTSDSGLSGPIAASVPSTPTSPIPNSDCISNRSDSTGTSNRSFAFPVLPREWTSSPVKMENTNKRRYRKCRGCSALFCCK